MYELTDLQESFVYKLRNYELIHEWTKTNEQTEHIESNILAIYLSIYLSIWQKNCLLQISHIRKQ